MQKKTIDQYVFETAHNIAANHIHSPWYESNVKALIRTIKLRQAIYDAIMEERQNGRQGADGGSNPQTQVQHDV